MARKYESESRRADGGVRVNAYMVNAVAPGRLEYGAKDGVVDDVLFRVMHVGKMKERLKIGWGDTVMGLKDVPAPTSIVCRALSPGEAEDAVNRSIHASDPQAGDGMRTYMERRRKLQEAEHAQEVGEMLVEDNETFYEVNIYTCLRAEDAAGLRRAEEKYRNHVKAGGNGASRLFANTRADFWSCSPFMTANPTSAAQNSVIMPGSTLAWALPFGSTGIDDGAGVVVGRDSLGGIVRIDIERHTEARPNSNVLVVGETGSGKSTLVKHVILSEFLLYGAKVIVLGDPEGEYGKLALSVGGDLTRIGRDCKISPFEPRNIGSLDADVDGWELAGREEMEAAIEQARSEYVLATTIPFVKTFLQMAFAGINDDLMDYLDIALEELYAKYGIGVDTTFAEYYAGPQRYPVMSELYEVLASLQERDPSRAAAYSRLALAIRSAAIGHEKHLWNSRTHFDPSSDFVVIDTQGLSEDKRIKAAQYYNLLTWSWSQVRAQRYSGQYVRLVADEVHTIMNKECLAAAYQVRNIVQRIRKYGGGIMLITQTPSSLLGGATADAGKDILSGTAYQFFGKTTGPEAGGNLNLVQMRLDLPDEVAAKMASFRRREFVASIGSAKVRLTAMQLPSWELELFGSGGGR